MLNGTDTTTVTSENANVSITNEWSPALVDGKFNKANQEYTLITTVKGNDGYILGDSFTAKLSDGTTGKLDKNTNSYIITKVVGKTGDAEMTGIEVTKQPTKTEYEINESYDPSGSEVVATFNDGTTKVIPSSEYTVTDSTFDDTSRNSVTITYKGFEAKVNNLKVNLKDAKADIFKTENSEFEYDATDKSNDALAKVSLILQEKETGKVTYTIKDDKGNVVSEVKELGIYKIFASIAGGSLYAAKNDIELSTITIVPKTIKSLDLTGTISTPVKSGVASSTITGEGVTTTTSWSPELLTGDKFDSDTVYTATVTVTPKNGYKFDDKSIVNFNGFTQSKDGENIVLTKTFEKTESLAVKDLIISKQPNKKEYEVGDVFDKTGMEVKVVYEDNSEKTVTTYTVLEGDSLVKNQTSVKVTYGDKEAIVDGITVKLKTPTADLVENNNEPLTFNGKDQKETILNNIVSNATQAETGKITYIIKDSKGNVVTEVKDADTYSIYITTEGGDKFDKQVEELKVGEVVINKKDIADLDFDNIANQLYSGEEIKPEVKSKTLAVSDYEVKSYTNNVNVGNSATVNIEGKGNYKGNVSKTFIIDPIVLTSNDLEVVSTGITKPYDGNTSVKKIDIKVKNTSLKGTDKLVVEGTSKFDTKDVGVGKQITITPNAITSGNYRLDSKEVLITTGDITPLTDGKDTTITGTIDKPIGSIAVSVK